MLKYVILLGSVVLLQACDDSSMYNARAEFLCEDNSGLHWRGYQGPNVAIVYKEGTEYNMTVKEFRKVSGPGVAKHLENIEESEGNRDES